MGACGERYPWLSRQLLRLLWTHVVDALSSILFLENIIPKDLLDLIVVSLRILLNWLSLLSIALAIKITFTTPMGACGDPTVLDFIFRENHPQKDSHDLLDLIITSLQILKQFPSFISSGSTIAYGSLPLKFYLIPYQCVSWELKLN